MKKFFLLGMPASGKSRLGKFIATNSKLDFIDLDKEIEGKLKLGVKDIFEKMGEIYFRNQETKILGDIIKDRNEFILATGGGTPVYNNNMSLINKSGVSIFIDVDRDTLIERISRNNKRPLFKNDISVGEKLDKLYLERINFYKKSTHTINKSIRDSALSIINSYT